MTVPSFDMYRILRSMCLIHGIPDHGVPRSTLHSWKVKGVPDALIESLSLHLTWYDPQEVRAWWAAMTKEQKE